MTSAKVHPPRRFAFTHRGRPFEVVVTDQGVLELYLDGLLRKARGPSGRATQYVWTNVELQWEEHHYVEVRYEAATGRMQVHVNRQPVHDLVLPP